jgi:hypothetical protein
MHPGTELIIKEIGISALLIPQHSQSKLSDVIGRVRLQSNQVRKT